MKTSRFAHISYLADLNRLRRPGEMDDKLNHLRKRCQPAWSKIRETQIKPEGLRQMTFRSGGARSEESNQDMREWNEKKLHRVTLIDVAVGAESQMDLCCSTTRSVSLQTKKFRATRLSVLWLITCNLLRETKISRVIEREHVSENIGSFVIQRQSGGEKKKNFRFRSFKLSRRLKVFFLLLMKWKRFQVSGWIWNLHANNKEIFDRLDEIFFKNV